jgi:hypothetical protein
MMMRNYFLIPDDIDCVYVSAAETPKIRDVFLPTVLEPSLLDPDPS